MELPQNLSWHQLLEEVRCFTHSQQCPVEVRRFAIASHANLRFERGGELNAAIQFTDNNQGLGGIGFTQSVDGLVFRLHLPETLKVNHLDNSEKARSLRTAYFRHCILTESRLDKIANIFQRDWLYQIYLSLLTATALSENISLPQALASIQNQGLGEAMGSVLDNIFQSLNVEETFLETAEEAVEETNDTQRRQRVQERLLDLCHQEEVQAVLNDKASVLWSDPDEDWYRWVEWRFKATLGGALLEACSQLCPQFDTLDLILDIDPGVRPTHAWRFQVIYGLLWARGNSVRSRALSSYNPFSPLPEADRELLLDVLPENEQEIRLEEENPDWREQVETIFQQGRSVLLVSSQRQVLTSAILELLAEPIELGFLQVYPQVEGIQRDARGFGVRVTVREGIIQ